MLVDPRTLSNTQARPAPGVIDLGLGYPDPQLLDPDAMLRATASALARHGAEALEYGHNPGPGPLRAWICNRVTATEGRALTPAELYISSGNSQALDVLLSLFVQPGQTVLVESPTYHLAVRILRDHPVNLVNVPADEQGLRTDVLAETLVRLRAEGRPAKVLYLVPTFNNPTGASLALERRARLIELAQAEGVLILEDDVYRDLAYDAPALPSLWRMAPSGVVARMGSFSKTLAPGLRLGFISGGPELIARIEQSGLTDSGGGFNHYTGCVIGALCDAGDYERQVAKLTAAYRERRDALIAALREHLPPGCRVRPPGGGFFTWVELPAGMDTAKMRPAAVAGGVAYVPGAKFHTDAGGGANALRLAFTMYSPEQLIEGARRLGNVIRVEIR